MKKFYYILIALLIYLGSGAVGLGARFPEQELRSQLDRLFYAEQYLLDIRVSPLKNPGGTLATPNSPPLPLPGLAIVPLPTGTPGSHTLGDPSKSPYDLLLVVDTSISQARQNIAAEVIKRHLESYGFDKSTKVDIRRQPILKVVPKDLAPLASRDPFQGSGSKPAEQKPDQDGKTPPNGAQEKTQDNQKQNIYDFIEHKRELATKVLITLWTAGASLIALFAFLHRPRKSNGAPREVPSPAHGVQGNGPSPQKATPQGGTKAGLSKEDLFSKDEALFKQVQEMVQEAQQAPHKVAHILTRWVEATDERSRYGSIFLKNCDIKTTESICKNLHPSDIEKLISRSISDFEPFSDDNRRALELMRNELAMMAAQQSFKEKLNPLPFLKIISDDDLAKLLDASSLKELAMIATLVPAHRLTRFFETHPQITYKDLLTSVALLEDLEPQHFVPLQLRLEEKLQKISSIVVTKDQKVNSIKQLIISIKDPKIQSEAARSTFVNQTKLFEDIRPSLILFEDLINLSQRAAKVLFQSIDGEALGIAWSGLSIDANFIASLLPEAIRETFLQTTALTPEHVDQCNAWQRVLTHFEDLKASGLISSSEIRLAQQKTDLSWSTSLSQIPDDKGGPRREAA